MHKKELEKNTFEDVSFGKHYSKKMILGPTDRPKNIPMWIMLSIQHMFAMFGATVLVPLLINGAVGNGQTVISIQVALMSSGIGTLIYILLTKAKVPIYLGSSFAYVSAVISLYPIYGTSTFFGFLGVGIIYIIVATLIYFFGVKWLKKILSPIVVGPMIIIIGLALASNAINAIGLLPQHYSFIKEGQIATGTVPTDWWGVAVAILTIIIAILSTLLFRGRLKLMPFLIAIFGGLIIALIVYSWHRTYQGLNASHTGLETKDFVNFGKFKSEGNKLSTYLGAPQFESSMFKGFGNKGFNITPLFLMMPIAFVTIAEHIGDHTVLGKITNNDFIGKEPGLHRTLLGDGLATAFAGVAGGPANTSYGENTTVVGMSRVASTYVTGLAAIFAVFMSFIAVVANVLSIIPQPVIGAVEIILFGFIASNGLKILIQDQIDLSNLRNMFIVLIMLVIGVGGATIAIAVANSTVLLKGMSLALLIGVILNLTLPNEKPLNEHVFDSIANGKKHRSDKMGKY